MSVAEVIKDVKDHPSGPVEACKPSSKRLLSSPNGVSLRKSRGEVPKSRSLCISAVRRIWDWQYWSLMMSDDDVLFSYSDLREMGWTLWRELELLKVSKWQDDQSLVGLAMVGHDRPWVSWQFRDVEVQWLVGPVAAQHPLGSAGVGGRTEAQSCVHTVAVVIGTIGTKNLGYFNMFQHIGYVCAMIHFGSFWIWCTYVIIHSLIWFLWS